MTGKERRLIDALETELDVIANDVHTSAEADVEIKRLFAIKRYKKNLRANPTGCGATEDVAPFGNFLECIEGHTAAAGQHLLGTPSSTRRSAWTNSWHTPKLWTRR